MDAVRSQIRLDSFNPFDIVLFTSGVPESVVLQSAPDPDRATMAFNEEFARLTREHVAGDLLLMHSNVEARTLLWEPLG